MPSEIPDKLNRSMIFRLSSKRSPKEVNLKSLEWAVVTQLNGEKTMGQIGEILTLSQNEVQKIFSRLFEEGLLEFVKSQSEDNSPAPLFLDTLEHQFKMYVGPVADIIVNDTLAELKTSREHLEKSQIPLIVELIGHQISNEKKRVQFQKEMLIEIEELLHGN